MKLLFDENLSRRLVELVASVYSDSTHPDLVDLRGASDSDIWIYAKTHGMAIVSKDNDFRQRAFLQGPPPKVIWLAVGNAGTTAISDLLINRVEHIRQFSKDPDDALLVLEPL